MTIGEIFNSRIIDRVNIVIYSIESSSVGLSIRDRFEELNKLPRILANIEIKELKIKDQYDNTIGIMISDEDMQKIFENKKEIDELLDLAKIKR